MSAAIIELQNLRASLASGLEKRNKALAEIETEFAANCETFKQWISKDAADIADIDAALKTLGATE